MAKKKITLDNFFQEFLKFTKNNEQQWKLNDNRWEENNKQLKVINRKFDKMFNFLDKEVMKNRKKINSLEGKYFKQ